MAKLVRENNWDLDFTYEELCSTLGPRVPCKFNRTARGHEGITKIRNK